MQLVRRIFEWIPCGVFIAMGLLACNCASAAPLRIMPVGDSLTRGLISPPPGVIPGGYRTRLYDRLSTELFPVRGVDFVGTANDNPDPGNLPDSDHEGHGGWRIDEIAAGMSGYLSANTPDVILMHLGTNDVAQDFDLANASTRLDSLITQITTSAPDAYLIVAQIITSTSAGEAAQISAYNAALPGIVAAHQGLGQRVSLVNMNPVIPLGDFVDAYHPGKAGYDKLADAWFTAIDALDLEVQAAVVPEPACWPLLGALLLIRRRRQKIRCADNK